MSSADKVAMPLFVVGGAHVFFLPFIHVLVDVPRLRRCLEVHGINETHISAVLLFDARSYVSMKTEWGAQVLRVDHTKGAPKQHRV